MRQRPLIFTGLSLFNILIAFSLPLQVAMMYKHNTSELIYILDKLTYTNWLVMLSCIIVSVAFFWAHQSLKYLIPVSAVFVLINNLLVVRYGHNYDTTTVFYATVAYIFIQFSLYYFKESRIITDQKLRWWLIPKRHKIEANVWLHRKGEKHLIGSTFDISQTGLFLKYDLKEIKEVIAELSMGEDIQITIDLPDKITCEAQVVRKALPKGNYPAGLGMSFTSFKSLDSLRLIKQLHAA